VLQAILGWAAADLRGWPKEHQRVRWVLVLGALEAASLGWIAVAFLGVPANVSSSKVRLEAASSLWFALGLILVVMLSGAPLVFYARYVQGLAASIVTGVALIAFIVYAFGFMVTSTSAAAGQAILGPFFLNYFVFAAGMGLDRILRRRRAQLGVIKALVSRVARTVAACTFRVNLLPRADSAHEGVHRTRLRRGLSTRIRS